MNTQITNAIATLSDVMADLNARGCEFCTISADWSGSPSIQLSSGATGLAGTGIVATEQRQGAYGSSDKIWFSGTYRGVRLVWSMPREATLSPVTVTL
jgi:hypothetical protein